MKKKEYCTECGKELDPNTMIFLELSTEDNMYREPGKIPEDESQGGFSFGSTCAKKMLKQSKEYDRRNNQ